jgi:hypothetical protein
MKELGIAMDFQSQDDNHDITLPAIAPTICKMPAQSACEN